MSATQEVKAALEDIQKALAAERELNEQARSEIKKHGAELPETRAALEKVGGEIDTVKATLDKLSASVSRLTIGGAGAEEKGVAKFAAKFFSQVQGKRISTDKADVQAYAAYREAFAEAARYDYDPARIPADVKAALSVGTDREGGFFAPAEMSTEIERRVFETSPVRQIARVVTIGRGAWEAPYISSKGVSGGWVGEKSSRANTGNPDIGMQRIEVHEQYAYPQVTQSMLDDGVIDVEGFLVEETEEEMSRTENVAFVSGDGVMKPRGFLSYGADAVTTADATRPWGKLQYVPTGEDGGFLPASGLPDDARVLIDLMAKLNPVYRPGARWTMNRNTEATIRKMRDADGRYLVEFGSLGDGVFGFSLHGHPITNLEDMPDIASGTFSIAFGNFQRGYLIVDRAGYRMIRDVYSNKPYVGFYITKRTGGDVRNFDAIKLLKFSAS